MQYYMSNPDLKPYLNSVWHGLVLSGIIVGESMLLKRLLKIEIGDPSRADLEALVKLSSVVTAGFFIKDYLVRMGFPDNPVSHL
jgi:hypothetical protein